MSFNDIQNALNQKLSEIPALPIIFWPNDQREPKQGVSSIRPTLMMSTGQLETLTEYDRYEGIYQIDIFVPIKTGTSTILKIADTIRDSFKRQTLKSGTTEVWIQQISVSTAARDEAWWHCYVEVNFLSFN